MTADTLSTESVVKWVMSCPGFISVVRVQDQRPVCVPKETWPPVRISAPICLFRPTDRKQPVGLQEEEGRMLCGEREGESMLMEVEMPTTEGPIPGRFLVSQSGSHPTLDLAPTISPAWAVVARGRNGLLSRVCPVSPAPSPSRDTGNRQER